MKTDFIPETSGMSAETLERVINLAIERAKEGHVRAVVHKIPRDDRGGPRAPYIQFFKEGE